MRDESAEDVRLVFEPRSRSVDPALMMESLFKLSELESRVQLNMNVLVGGRIPRVVGLAEALTEWLTHRRDVLLRRSRYRLSQIEHRLEMLGGYLVAYLNLDKVIKIIRTEDEPKPVLMKTFKLSDVQADAILNMRLRNLRRLEEIEIREEDKKLRAEKKSIEGLLRSEQEQWKTIAGQIREVREKFGPKTPLGKRRTGFAQAPAHDEAAIEEALVEREPVTIVVSEKGWIRALRGQVADLSSLAFKSDDSLDHAFFAETTSKILVFATNGRFYTIDAAKLPGGRGHGEPIRLFIELEQQAEVVDVFRYQGGRKLMVASKQGRGFVVAEDECLANTRKGKQVLNVKPPDAACALGDGRGRTGGRHRRQPQDGRVPDRAGAGNDARPRRAAATPQGRRALRHQDLRSRKGPDLDRLRRPRVHALAQGTCRLARQPRRRRAFGAEGLSEEQQVRRQDGKRTGPLREWQRRGRLARPAAGYAQLTDRETPSARRTAPPDRTGPDKRAVAQDRAVAGGGSLPAPCGRSTRW